MKNILVLTDFSHTAYEALFYITGLYRHQDARFLILYAYTENTPLESPSTGSSQPKSLQIQLEDEALEGLRQTVHRIRRDRVNPRHEFKTSAIYQNLPDAVLSALSREKTDLIVMGNKGRSAVRSVFFGSNVIRILNAVSSCPILTVPEDTSNEQPVEIAFAADYNRTYSRKLLQPLLEFATLCSAAIRVVHINEEERLTPGQLQNLDQLKHSLEHTAYTLHWMPDFRTKTGAIHSFISELGIGMLAMVNYRHGLLDNLLREPVIKKVSFMVEVPLLILPDAK